MEDRHRIFTSALGKVTGWLNDTSILGVSLILKYMNSSSVGSLKDTGSGPDTLAQLFVLMAEYDILTKQTKYRGDLARWMRIINGTRPNFADELCV
jgi:hypothetical protein